MERMEMSSYVNVPLRPKPVRGSHSAERKWYLIHLFSFGLLCLIQVTLNIALRLTSSGQCDCNTTVLENQTSTPAPNETIIAQETEHDDRFLTWILEDKCECECSTTTPPPARNETVIAQETQRGNGSVTFHDTSVPVDCCFHFYERRLPKNKVKDYRRTSTGCTIKGVIVTMQNGKEFCVNPDQQWVRDITNFINAEVTPSPKLYWLCQKKKVEL